MKLISYLILFFTSLLYTYTNTNTIANIDFIEDYKIYTTTDRTTFIRSKKYICLIYFTDTIRIQEDFNKNNDNFNDMKIKCLDYLYEIIHAINRKNKIIVRYIIKIYIMIIITIISIIYDNFNNLK